MGLLAGRRPGNLGVRDGRLAPPPDSPNAVSSEVTTGYHAIPPIPYRGAREQAMRTLAEVVRQRPRTRIVQQTADYLYAECESALLGFVDDLEFHLPSDESVIHVRSASRLGHSDFGVNRKRVEEIRAAFNARQ